MKIIAASSLILVLLFVVSFVFLTASDASVRSPDQSTRPMPLSIKTPLEMASPTPVKCHQEPPPCENDSDCPVFVSGDADEDGVRDGCDNCVLAPNTNQADSNRNGIGDACDPLTNALADLSITMAESADPVQKGKPFDYVVTIRNNGASLARGVVFDHKLPSKVTFVSISTTQGQCVGRASIDCRLGAIPNKTSAIVKIRVVPTVAGRLDSYSGTYSESTPDPNILNNKGSASTNIFDPAQTLIISGRVTDENDEGVAAVSIGIEGPRRDSTETDSTGRFSISIAAGGIYMVMPSKHGFVFQYPLRQVAYIDENKTVEFRAIKSTFSVSGRVLGKSGRPLSQAVVTITDLVGNTLASSMTDSHGSYTFGATAREQVLTVTLDHPLHRFEPRTITVVEDINDFDFVAIP